jgi:hypothetical protein
LTCKALVNNKSRSKCWLVSRKNADTERCNWWNPTWWKKLELRRVPSLPLHQ